MRFDIEHVLLTRFNLPSAGSESLIRAQDGWLTGRVRLFERYCLPSVAGQSEQRFTWLVYFDPQSPTWLHEWYAPLAAAGAFRPILRDQVSRDDLRIDIEAAIGWAPRSLLTTNLDNDDAIGTDFVAHVQAAAGGNTRTAIYLSDGLIKSPHALYRRTDRHNAFCSVYEPWRDAVTCWVDWHNRLPERMPVVEVGGSPAWLQVVHGSNVSNRVRGRLVSPEAFGAAFPGLLDDLAEPSRSQLAVDRLIERPARVIRDALRAGAKRGVLALVGKDGLDRAKLTVVATRRVASAAPSRIRQTSQKVIARVRQ